MQRPGKSGVYSGFVSWWNPELWRICWNADSKMWRNKPGGSPCECWASWRTIQIVLRSSILHNWFKPTMHAQICTFTRCQEDGKIHTLKTGKAHKLHHLLWIRLGTFPHCCNEQDCTACSAALPTSWLTSRKTQRPCPLESQYWTSLLAMFSGPGTERFEGAGNPWPECGEDLETAEAWSHQPDQEVAEQALRLQPEAQRCRKTKIEDSFGYLR